MSYCRLRRAETTWTIEANTRLVARALCSYYRDAGANSPGCISLYLLARSDCVLCRFANTWYLRDSTTSSDVSNSSCSPLLTVLRAIAPLPIRSYQS